MKSLAGSPSPRQQNRRGRCVDRPRHESSLLIRLPRSLGRLALHHPTPLLAVDRDRVYKRGYPDHDYEGVDDEDGGPFDAYGPEEGAYLPGRRASLPWTSLRFQTSSARPPMPA